MSSSAVIQGLSLSRRLMATTNQLTTYDVTQTQKQNLPLTSPATFSTLDALNQAWLYAGEQFIYTAHSCGYGFSASTCGNCQNGACFDLKSGGPCVAQYDTCNGDGVASLIQITINYATTSVFSIASINGVSVAKLTVQYDTFT